MWPINPDKCVEQLKKFAPQDFTETPENDPTSLPAPMPPRVQPTTLMQVELGLDAWQEKIQRRMDWSDPVQPEQFESFIDSSKKIFTEATFNDVQLSIFRKRREEDLQAKTISRKRLRSSGSGLGLTKEKAQEMISEKIRTEKEVERKKTDNAFMKIWRPERDLQLANGVAARKSERARLKKVKELKAKGFPVPPELDVVIPDHSQFWMKTNPTWLAQVAAKNAKKKCDHSKSWE